MKHLTCTTCGSELPAIRRSAAGQGLHIEMEGGAKLRESRYVWLKGKYAFFCDNACKKLFLDKSSPAK